MCFFYIMFRFMSIPLTCVYMSHCYVSLRRQNSDYSPSAVKRQRIDSSPHPSLGSSYIRIAQPPCYPDQVESSRSSFEGLNHFLSSPLFYPQAEVLSVPESSSCLQLYAKDEVHPYCVYLHLTCML